MSNDDLNDLKPSEANPLEGDVFGDMGPLAAPAADDATLLADAAASSLPGDETADMSPLLAGASLPLDDDAALASPLPADEEAATPETAEEEPAKEEKEKGPGFLAKLAESNPYTVILAASVTALLVGILCLVLELSSYGFDVKAKEAGQSMRISTPVNAGVASGSRMLSA